jgi:hypothetical protein
MRESCTYGSVRGARGKLASLPRRASRKLVRSSRCKSGPPKLRSSVRLVASVAAGGAR